MTANCDSDTTYLLTYRANRDQGEHVTVAVRGAIIKRKDLDPRHALSFTLNVTRRPIGISAIEETPEVTLTAQVNGEPFDAQAVARFKLAGAADQTGECVAESATVKVSTHFHFA